MIIGTWRIKLFCGRILQGGPKHRAQTWAKGELKKIYCWQGDVGWRKQRGAWLGWMAKPHQPLTLGVSTQATRQERIHYETWENIHKIQPLTTPEAEQVMTVAVGEILYTVCKPFYRCAPMCHF